MPSCARRRFHLTRSLSAGHKPWIRLKRHAKLTSKDSLRNRKFSRLQTGTLMMPQDRKRFQSLNEWKLNIWTLSTRYLLSEASIQRLLLMLKASLLTFRYTLRQTWPRPRKTKKISQTQIVQNLVTPPKIPKMSNHPTQTSTKAKLLIRFPTRARARHKQTLSVATLWLALTVL